MQHLLLLTIVSVLMVATNSAGTFHTWAAWNEDCTKGCDSQLRIRFCKEDATGSGCGAASTYVEITSCCAAATWGAWGAYSGCSDTCGACGRETRTRVCNPEKAGCPEDCVGEKTENGTIPCDNKKVCLMPRAACCPGFTKQTDMPNKTFWCVQI